MKLFTSIKKRYFVIFIMVVVFSFFLVHMVQAVTTPPPAEPGSDGDPLVTQGYVDLKLNDVTQKVSGITPRLDAIDKKLEESTGSGGEAGFEVVTVEAGKKLITGAGTELIVRSGTSKGIKGLGGGLADITLGKDIGTGVAVGANHLLISSRDDGRGITAGSLLYVLVRGKYEIK